MDVCWSMSRPPTLWFVSTTTATPATPTITTEYRIDGSFDGASSVYAVDMDGDGDKELVFGTLDGTLYVLNKDGTDY